MGSHPRGGALVLVGDDPAAKSSTLPCASDGALADLTIPYLYPADSQDVLDLGRHAIELSRATGLWVGSEDRHRGRGRIVHGRPGRGLAGPADPAGRRDARAHRPAAAPHAGPARARPGTNRLRLAREYARLNGLNRVVGRGQADVLGVVAAGHTWLDVLAALRRLGIGEDGPGRQPGPPAAGRHAVAARGGHRPRVRRRAGGDPGRRGEALLPRGRHPRRALRRPGASRPSPASATPTARSCFPAYGELDADAILGPLRRRMTARGIAAAPGPAGVRRGMPGPLVAPRSSAGCRTSARAARTTAPPSRCPGPWWAPASAATPWCC